MYNWRKMTEEQREYVLNLRRIDKHPWHSPPHIQPDGINRFIITSACYEHKCHIGLSPERIQKFEVELLKDIGEFADEIYAWVVLPNHYHVLLKTENILELLKKIHKLHGRTSFHWNGEEDKRGRRVWCNALERSISSKRHFRAAVNYIHHNPVKHGYVQKWTHWPYSSTETYIQQKGREQVFDEWNEYDISEMGDNWDAF